MVTVLAAVVGACFCGVRTSHAELGTLAQLHAALAAAADPQALLDQLSPLTVIAGKAPVEQAEFIRKALREELSADGLRILGQNGQFGPLLKVFPTEAANWSSQAGMKLEDCVAFSLERDTITAEVVLVRTGDTFRVVRCNNVKQLARNQ